MRGYASGDVAGTLTAPRVGQATHLAGGVPGPEELAVPLCDCQGADGSADKVGDEDVLRSSRAGRRARAERLICGSGEPSGGLSVSRTSHGAGVGEWVLALLWPACGLSRALQKGA